MFVTLLKDYARIGSPMAMFLTLVFVTGWLYWRPSAKGPRRLLLILTLSFWFISTPIGSGLLASTLSYRFTQLSSREAAGGADTVVVLAGGAETISAGGQVIGVLTTASALRALEGARVFKLIGAKTIIVSGGTPNPAIQLRPESEILQDALIEAGVPAASIVQETASTTTRRQARMLNPLLRARGARRFVLVTSPTHMRRSIAVFRSEGLDPVPSVSLFRSEHLPIGPFFLPGHDALMLSDMVVYDIAASLHYWWQGWTVDRRGS